MSLTYVPSSEPMHIAVKYLFRDRSSAVRDLLDGPISNCWAVRGGNPRDQSLDLCVQWCNLGITPKPQTPNPNHSQTLYPQP